MARGKKASKAELVAASLIKGRVFPRERIDGDSGGIAGFRVIGVDFRERSNAATRR